MEEELDQIGAKDIIILLFLQRLGMVSPNDTFLIKVVWGEGRAYLPVRFRRVRWRLT